MNHQFTPSTGTPVTLDDLDMYTDMKDFEAYLSCAPSPLTKVFPEAADIFPSSPTLETEHLINLPGEPDTSNATTASTHDLMEDSFSDHSSMDAPISDLPHTSHNNNNSISSNSRKRPNSLSIDTKAHKRLPLHKRERMPSITDEMSPIVSLSQNQLYHVSMPRIRIVDIDSLLQKKDYASTQKLLSLGPYLLKLNLASVDNLPKKDLLYLYRVTHALLYIKDLECSKQKRDQLNQKIHRKLKREPTLQNIEGMQKPETKEVSVSTDAASHTATHTACQTVQTLTAERKDFTMQFGRGDSDCAEQAIQVGHQSNNTSTETQTDFKPSTQNVHTQSIPPSTNVAQCQTSSTQPTMQNAQTQSIAASTNAAQCQTLPTQTSTVNTQTRTTTSESVDIQTEIVKKQERALQIAPSTTEQYVETNRIETRHVQVQQNDLMKEKISAERDDLKKQMEALYQKIRDYEAQERVFKKKFQQQHHLISKCRHALKQNRENQQKVCNQLNREHKKSEALHQTLKRAMVCVKKLGASHLLKDDFVPKKQEGYSSAKREGEFSFTSLRSGLSCGDGTHQMGTAAALASATPGKFQNGGLPKDFLVRDET